MLEDRLEFDGIILHFNKRGGFIIFFRGRNRKKVVPPLNWKNGYKITLVDHNNIILTYEYTLLTTWYIFYIGIYFILCTLGIFRQNLTKRRNIFSNELCVLLDVL